MNCFCINMTDRFKQYREVLEAMDKRAFGPCRICRTVMPKINNGWVEACAYEKCPVYNACQQKIDARNDAQKGLLIAKRPINPEAIKAHVQNLIDSINNDGRFYYNDKDKKVYAARNKKAD